jgi:hypothetical protein
VLWDYSANVERRCHLKCTVNVGVEASGDVTSAASLHPIQHTATASPVPGFPWNVWFPCALVDRLLEEASECNLVMDGHVVDGVNWPPVNTSQMHHVRKKLMESKYMAG